MHNIMKKNLHTWISIARDYAKHGRWTDLQTLFWKINTEGFVLNSYMYEVFLQACAHLQDVENGKRINLHSAKYGFDTDIAVGNALINMYIQCRSLDAAHAVFDNMCVRNVESWKSMLIGYSNNELPQKAIEFFWEMQRDNNEVKNDKAILSCVLKICSRIRALREGKEVHDYIIRNRLESTLSVGNTLIDMYSKCGSLVDARNIFDNIEQPDVFTFSSMIAGYGEHKNSCESFELFAEMEKKGMYTNDVTLLNILKSCSSDEYLEKAREIHSRIIKRALTFNGFLENSLVDVYAKCGSLADSCYVFKTLPVRNIVSWSSLISGNVQHGLYNDALLVFYQMGAGGVKPNASTFASTLKAVSALQCLEIGQCLHFLIAEHKLESGLFVGSALLDMYAKCGCPDDAQKVFNAMPDRNIVSWSSIIACYAQHGTPVETISLFWQMHGEGVEPDKVTLVSMFKACGNWGMLDTGKEIQNYALRLGHKLNFFLGSTLIDMYNKCGELYDAWCVFREIECRDSALWNAMIIAYGQHGLASDAFELLKKMQEDGLQLDHVTFVGMLSVCSHSGLLDEGKHLFHCTRLEQCIPLTTEHCVCMTDLFGRVGCLWEAVELVQKMPFQHVPVIWVSLLGSCRINCHIVLAQMVIDSLLELDPDNAAGYVTLSNIAYEVG